MSPKPHRNGTSGWLGRPTARLKSLVVVGTATLGLAGIGIATAGPAAADPAVSYVAVGTDATQDVMNGFAGSVSEGIIGSYNADGFRIPVHGIITPAKALAGGSQSNCSFTRPANSLEGFNALDLMTNMLNPQPQLTFPPQPGCIDISRSSDPPGSVCAGTGKPGCLDPSGSLVYIPFGLEGRATGATGPTATHFSFTATMASPAMFTAAGSSYQAGATVELSGTLPGGFTAGTVYFVVNPSGTTFELAATPGGAAIASTSTGSGTVLTVTTTQCVSTTSGCTNGTITFNPTPTSITQADMFTLANLQTLYSSCTSVTVNGITYNPNTAGAGQVQIDLYAPQPGSPLLNLWASTLGFSATTPPACVHQTIVAGPANGIQVAEDDGSAYASDPNGYGPLSITQWIAQSNGLVPGPDSRHTAILHSLTNIAPIVSGTLNPNFPAQFLREVYNVVEYDRVVNTGDGNFDPMLAGLFAGSASRLCTSTFTIKSYGFSPLPNPSFPDACGATTAALRVVE